MTSKSSGRVSTCCKRDVGDGVLDDDAGTRFAHWDLAPRTAVDFLRAEIFFAIS